MMMMMTMIMFARVWVREIIWQIQREDDEKRIFGCDKIKMIVNFKNFTLPELLCKDKL